MLVTNGIYITTLIIGDAYNTIFCGVAKSIQGCARILRGLTVDFEWEVSSQSPCGVLLQSKKHPEVFARFEKVYRNSPWTKRKAWVITKRNEAKMCEQIMYIYDKEEVAKQNIFNLVEKPKFKIFKKCGITEVDGFVPYARKISSDNPELNRVHYTIYETEVEE